MLICLIKLKCFFNKLFARSLNVGKTIRWSLFSSKVELQSREGGKDIKHDGNEFFPLTFGMQFVANQIECETGVWIFNKKRTEKAKIVAQINFLLPQFQSKAS